MAIDDLHRTKSLAQKIDTFYVTILTLLLTADAYEIATTNFVSWIPVVATAGVALIGLVVSGRWVRGANNLFRIITNRYAWLRRAENADEHPEMARIRANIFTQEYKAVYEPQMKRQAKAKVGTIDDPAAVGRGFSTYYRLTYILQLLCIVIFVAVPVILAIAIYVKLHPSVAQSLQQLLGK